MLTPGRIIRYRVAEDGDPESWYTVETVYDLDESLEFAAEDAADDYFHNHNGWEAGWPLTFVLALEEGPELGRFTVEQEPRPEFVASKLETWEKNERP